MKKVAFVIERPLQLLISYCIISQFSENLNIRFHLVRAFDRVDFIARKITESSTHRVAVSVHDNYREAILFSAVEPIDNLFIHWDIGFRTDFRLAYLKCVREVKRISVFEEGVSIDRTDIYKGFKKTIFRLMGFAVHVGDNRFVDDIYLFKPKDYDQIFGKKSVPLIKIKKNITDLVSEDENFFNNLFGINRVMKTVESFDKEGCALYLTDWRFRPEVMAKIKTHNPIMLVKPHPFIRDEIKNNGDYVVLPSDMPAEIVIPVLSRHFKKIYVYHHGSSVNKYIELSNVRFIEC